MVIKMKYIATLNGKKYEIQIEKVPDYQPLSREQAIAPTFAPAPVAAPTETLTSAPTPMAAPEVASTSMTAGEANVVSPMPGSIFDIKVAPGQTVKFGQVIFVLEAMKMENEIVAPADGVIASVQVKKGDMVDTGAILAVIK